MDSYRGGIPVKTINIQIILLNKQLCQSGCLLLFVMTDLS